MAKRAMLDRSFETAEKTVRASIDAIRFINNPENKSVVVKSLARSLRLDKLEDAEAGYEMMRTLYDKRFYPDVEGLRNVIRILGRSSEQVRRLKAEDLVDDRVVRKLEKEGLF
jgi:hypothetical protein